MAKVLREVKRPLAKSPKRAGLTAKEYVDRIEQALMEGAHAEARRLADEGHAAYRSHAILRKYALLLAPPKVLDAHVPSNPGSAENYRWLKAEGHRYAGQWVAVYNGEFLGAAQTLRELRQSIELPAGTFLTKAT